MTYSNLERTPAIPRELEPVRELFSKIFVIVSPPRCCSTAFARVLWEHPAIAFYSHEPFEITYFRDAPLAEVAANLCAPLELHDVASQPTEAGVRALVIKEMPYQVGRYFPVLAELARPPLIFLLRDPRLSIASRMRKKREVGDNPFFPLVETGWELLRDQVAYCERMGIPYRIVRSIEFRNRPLAVFPQLCAELGLEFSEEMLSWRARGDLEIDNLGGDHTHLYRAVLSSDGLEPDFTPPPPVEDFPTEGGFREHVALCLEIYDELSRSPARIAPDE